MPTSRQSSALRSGSVVCLQDGFSAGGSGGVRVNARKQQSAAVTTADTPRPQIFGGYGDANRDFVSKARRVSLPNAVAKVGTTVGAVIDPTRLMR